MQFTVCWRDEVNVFKAISFKLINHFLKMHANGWYKISLPIKLYLTNFKIINNKILAMDFTKPIETLKCEIQRLLSIKKHNERHSLSNENVYVDIESTMVAIEILRGKADFDDYAN